jgi:peptidoglycan biosynthesis protein MviN/MurJ (putative lipid II flippase)
VKQAIARALRMARHPAAAVAAGIFASRLVGLLRVRAFSYYFGLQSDAADAFNAAFRIPNLLQNLFGEGALSGSFIPVYSGLRARGETEAPRGWRGRCSRCWPLRCPCCRSPAFSARRG